MTQTVTKKIYSAGLHLPLPANRESHNNQPKVADAIGLEVGATSVSGAKKSGREVILR